MAGPRLSEAQLAEYANRTNLGRQHLQAGGKAPEREKKIAPGQTAAGVMNKTEQRYYDEIIWPAIATKEIIRAGFEDEKFKIGDRCWYVPDFPIVWAPDTGKPKTYVEVKGGYIREKSLVKFKAAATKFPEYNWQLWQYKAESGWKCLHNLGAQ